MYHQPSTVHCPLSYLVGSNRSLAASYQSDYVCNVSHRGFTVRDPDIFKLSGYGYSPRYVGWLSDGPGGQHGLETQELSVSQGNDLRRRTNDGEFCVAPVPSSVLWFLDIWYTSL